MAIVPVVVQVAGMDLGDPANVQVDNLAVFSTTGQKRLKTTTASLSDLAQIEDSSTSSSTVWSSDKTNDELLTETGGNIIGNSTSGTAITSAVNNVILGSNCATSLASGNDNVVIGSLAAPNLTTSQNIAIGRVAAVNLATGTNNVFLGVGSGGGGGVSTTNSVFLVGTLLELITTTRQLLGSTRKQPLRTKWCWEGML